MPSVSMTPRMTAALKPRGTSLENRRGMTVAMTHAMTVACDGRAVIAQVQAIAADGTGRRS